MKSILRLILAACLGAMFSIAGVSVHAMDCGPGMEGMSGMGGECNGGGAPQEEMTGMSGMDCGPGMSGMSGMGGTCKDDASATAARSEEEMSGMSGMDCGPGMSGMSGMGGSCN